MYYTSAHSSLKSDLKFRTSLLPSVGSIFSQSKNGKLYIFQKDGFSIIKWFPLNGFQKDGFSIIKWFPLNGFQKDGFSIKKWKPHIFQKDGFSIKKWKTIYFSKRWFFNH